MARVKPTERPDAPADDAASSSCGQLRLAFSGAGLHGFYFNGVSRYICEQEIEVKEAWGASAGALAALSTLMQVGPEAYEEVFAMYDKHHMDMPWMFWHGRDFVWDSNGGGLRRYMPKGREEERAWLRKVVNGRLHVVVTRLGNFRFERVVVSSWDSVEDLVSCIRATMTIPGITAVCPLRWRGSLWIDGSFTNLHPSTDRTLLISTSVPVQPWAASWYHHVGIFRPLPVRMSWWHCSVGERRDMFKLGYMDAKAYFERDAAEPPSPRNALATSPSASRGAGMLRCRPAVRAAVFVSNLALELLQGCFLMVLTAGFVRRRWADWRSILPLLVRAMKRGPGTPARSTGALKASAATTQWARWAAVRLGVTAELLGLVAASLLMWCVAVDLRLDLSDFFINMAAGSKQVLWRSSAAVGLPVLREERRASTSAVALVALGAPPSPGGRRAAVAAGRAPRQ